MTSMDGTAAALQGNRQRPSKRQEKEQRRTHDLAVSIVIAIGNSRLPSCRSISKDLGNLLKSVDKNQQSPNTLNRA